MYRKRKRLMRAEHRVSHPKNHLGSGQRRRMVKQNHAVAYNLGLCLLLFGIVLYFFKNRNEWENFVYGGGSIGSISSLSLSMYHHADNKQRSLNKNNIYYVGAEAVVNQWYGWQPKVHSSMECSWKVCMMDNHTCKTCRDSPDDMNVANSSSLDPGTGWIPDVTMLRRMYVDGRDADGNPWPPPLEDDLCKALEDNNKTKELFDVVPIVSLPIPRTPESDKNNNKVLCMIYTMEKAHATGIRAMRETWAPGCDGFLAFSTKTDPRIPAISIPHIGPEDHSNMWQKVRTMWAFVGKHYLSEFDWFYIGGDDMIAFPQNVKKFLGTYSSSEPHFLGRRFQQPGTRGFNWRPGLCPLATVSGLPSGTLGGPSVPTGDKDHGRGSSDCPLFGRGM